MDENVKKQKRIKLYNPYKQFKKDFKEENPEDEIYIPKNVDDLVRYENTDELEEIRQIIYRDIYMRPVINGVP